MLGDGREGLGVDGVEKTDGGGGGGGVIEWVHGCFGTPSSCFRRSITMQ